MAMLEITYNIVAPLFNLVKAMNGIIDGQYRTEGLQL